MFSAFPQQENSKLISTKWAAIDLAVKEKKKHQKRNIFYCLKRCRQYKGKERERKKTCMRSFYTCFVCQYRIGSNHINIFFSNTFVLHFHKQLMESFVSNLMSRFLDNHFSFALLWGIFFNHFINLCCNLQSFLTYNPEVDQCCHLWKLCRKILHKKSKKKIQNIRIKKKEQKQSLISGPVGFF